VRLIGEQTGRFIEENREALRNDPAGKSLPADWAEMKEAMAAMSSEEGRKDISEVYGFAIEPIVLLYDGVELGRIIGGLGADPTGVSSTTGITMPGMSALKQNFPNPASARTTIPYVVADASTATVIRVFNATGDLVATHDQGPRPAGEHALDLDVADLPTGTYLYHLTLQTSKGQRVYSKAMQVVH
jgi:hypothetical protein